MASGEAIAVSVRGATGVTHTIQIGADATVAELKAKIATHFENFPPPRQRLIFKGRALADDAVLSSVGVIAGSQVFLTARLQQGVEYPTEGAASAGPPAAAAAAPGLAGFTGPATAAQGFPGGMNFGLDRTIMIPVDLSGGGGGAGALAALLGQVFSSMVGGGGGAVGGAPGSNIAEVRVMPLGVSTAPGRAAAAPPIPGSQGQGSSSPVRSSSRATGRSATAMAGSSSRASSAPPPSAAASAATRRSLSAEAAEAAGNAGALASAVVPPGASASPAVSGAAPPSGSASSTSVRAPDQALDSALDDLFGAAAAHSSSSGVAAVAAAPARAEPVLPPAAAASSIVRMPMVPPAAAASGIVRMPMVPPAAAAMVGGVPLQLVFTSMPPPPLPPPPLPLMTAAQLPPLGLGGPPLGLGGPVGTFGVPSPGAASLQFMGLPTSVPVAAASYPVVVAPTGAQQAGARAVLSEASPRAASPMALPRLSIDTGGRWALQLAAAPLAATLAHAGAALHQQVQAQRQGGQQEQPLAPAATAEPEIPLQALLRGHVQTTHCSFVTPVGVVRFSQAAGGPLIVNQFSAAHGAAAPVVHEAAGGEAFAGAAPAVAPAAEVLPPAALPPVPPSAAPTPAPAPTASEPQPLIAQPPKPAIASSPAESTDPSAARAGAAGTTTASSTSPSADTAALLRPASGTTSAARPPPMVPSPAAVEWHARSPPHSATPPSVAHHQPLRRISTRTSVSSMGVGPPTYEPPLAVINNVGLQHTISPFRTQYGRRRPTNASTGAAAIATVAVTSDVGSRRNASPPVAAGASSSRGPASVERTPVQIYAASTASATDVATDASAGTATSPPPTVPSAAAPSPAASAPVVGAAGPSPTVPGAAASMLVPSAPIDVSSPALPHGPLLQPQASLADVQGQVVQAQAQLLQLQSQQQVVFNQQQQWFMAAAAWYSQQQQQQQLLLQLQQQNLRGFASNPSATAGASEQRPVARTAASQSSFAANLRGAFSGGASGASGTGLRSAQQGATRQRGAASSSGAAADATAPGNLAAEVAPTVSLATASAPASAAATTSAPSITAAASLAASPATSSASPMAGGAVPTVSTVSASLASVDEGVDEDDSLPPLIPVRGAAGPTAAAEGVTRRIHFRD